MTDRGTPFLQVEGVSKSFPGVKALRDVHLHVHEGEVLALIGENGAGKSTLMKILAGVQTPDSGRILIRGQEVRLESVAASMRCGIALIHQELNLADNLSVGANIYLGREPRRWGWIQSRKLLCDADVFLQKIGLDVSARTPLSQLSIGKQQLVEIAKAMSVNARVLIMDEPTSSLSSHETEQLLRVVKELRAKGIGIIYISHRLGEVKELADRVTVFRDGANAGELAGDEIEHGAMVQRMVGRDISQVYARTPHPLGETLLEVTGLVTQAWPKHANSFSVRRGEIVGVAGLVGAGRTEMIRAIFGVDSPLSGSVRLDGQSVELGSPQRAIEAGMALVPEDRKRQGLVVDMTVRNNVGLADCGRADVP